MSWHLPPELGLTIRPDYLIPQWTVLYTQDWTFTKSARGRERRLAIVGNEPQFASGVRHSRKAVTSLLARAFAPQRGLP